MVAGSERSLNQHQVLAAHLIVAQFFQELTCVPPCTIAFVIIKGARRMGLLVLQFHASHHACEGSAKFCGFCGRRIIGVVVAIERIINIVVASK